MPEGHDTRGSGPGGEPADRHRFRRRAVAAGAFTAVVACGLVLALALGNPDGGKSGQPETRRSEHSLRPPNPPSRSSPKAPSWDRSPDSVAAVGDSITRGFDACSILADCPRVSWATGKDPGVRSVADRLLDHPVRDSWNYAVSGSRMADLPRQMRRAAGRSPELVTVMTGANDACRTDVGQMTPASGFRTGFREALRTLKTERPGAQVYVASVPDLGRLWSQGRQNPAAQRMWKLGICQSMLRDPGSTTAAAISRRQQVTDRVDAYNDVLKEECAEYARCRYDNGAVFGYRFTAAELSEWDWFHPGRAGQRELADLAYRGIVSQRP